MLVARSAVVVVAGARPERRVDNVRARVGESGSSVVAGAAAAGAAVALVVVIVVGMVVDAALAVAEGRRDRPALGTRPASVRPATVGVVAAGAAGVVAGLRMDDGT